MKKLLTALLMLTVSLAATAQPRPKLIVGIAVDQMRWDYLYRYYELYGDRGFKRLMSEGYNCENTQINYLPSVTAIGHTSIYTGSVPSIHGIAGNSFFMDGKLTYCTEDATVQGVGTTTKAGQMSPRNMLATTIGDELKVATNFKSKVIGVSIKDRAAILPAGHSADAAYWIDGGSSRFVSSTYYIKQLPGWVTRFNDAIGKDVKADDVNYSPLGNQLTTDMAIAAIREEKLGQRGQTDMITISYSCTDKIGHKYGTHCPLMQTIFVDLDKRIAQLIDYLDATIGKGEYLLFLSADHGAANNIKMLQEHGIPSGGYFYQREAKELNAHLQQKFSCPEQLVLGIISYAVSLNHAAIAKAGLNLGDVRAAVVDYYRDRKEVAYAVDMDKVSDATIPSVIREKIINGYNRFRSGDVQLVLQPAWYEIYGDQIDGGTTHGSWNPYDAHIPFLLYGWHVPHGTTQAASSITDIAPTVCSLVHIQMPNGCVGKAVELK